jgi:hypothetical protein
MKKPETTIGCFMVGAKLSDGYSTEAEEDTHDTCQIASPVGNRLEAKN